MLLMILILLALGLAAASPWLIAGSTGAAQLVRAVDRRLARPRSGVRAGDR